MRYTATADSDVGISKSTNQDSVLVKHASTDIGEVLMAIVCDGMGGVHGGQLASNIAINMVSDKIKLCYTQSMPVTSLENLLLSAITTANVTVFDRGIYDNSLKGMGTTIVATIIKNSTACIAHVGDSRAYKISEESIEQITRAHSLVQEMLDKGQITKEEFEIRRRTEELKRQFSVYKAKMEALLISQLELLQDKENEE